MIAETFHISSTRLDALCIFMVFAGFCVGYAWRVIRELDQRESSER